ncbi:MAG TPA: arginine deiminase family protein, partial [Thermoanaerobaculia bacterium]|nr:arginine deiminase family protein [Thermoanaerobaculia bacterium]
MTLAIESEIGRLRSVLVHEPGREIDRMVPSMMQDLLFDDILFGARAREEHRRFRQVLRFVADEVLEARDLLEEVLHDAEARNALLSELAGLLAWPPAVLLALNDLPADRLAAGLVEGVDRPRPEITGSLDSLYLLPPVPNWFFQRDPAVVLGDRVIRSAMATRARWREPILSGAIFAFHPRFGRRADAFWFREFASEEKSLSWARMRPTLEGGDVLVLSAETLVIGYSERTEKITIERLAEALRLGRSRVKRIFVVAIPPQRATMHLDTIFTRLSPAECLCYGPMILPGGAEEVDIYEADLTGREVSWTTRDDLLSALRARGIDLE